MGSLLAAGEAGGKDARAAVGLTFGRALHNVSHAPEDVTVERRWYARTGARSGSRGRGQSRPRTSRGLLLCGLLHVAVAAVGCFRALSPMGWWTFAGGSPMTLFEGWRLVVLLVWSTLADLWDRLSLGRRATA
jgi:hypothetical protein